jgi:hypothetical protein
VGRLIEEFKVLDIDIAVIIDEQTRLISKTIDDRPPIAAILSDDNPLLY